ncbi:HAD family hydrolase [Olsenella sp. HMSC062G07]|uniref:HAD family hydrolase n=1 Tax=Olsenella sp. HMSC062G07 TaxID=1739330 RepID=UPI0008A2DA8B|nr:HAD family hydrolase [Olsenella sp. HMSC062G07]OFK22149.1 haloacid dehalogenase [Olsenella sp. HMSC062G07]
MPALSLPTFPTDASSLPEDLADRLSRVRHVFSDTDGTMLSSSCALVASDGTPSFELARTLVDARRAGLDVITCTGRNRAMAREDARLLGMDGWIGEMGGILCLSEAGAGTWHYFTADMPYDEASGKTPHDVITETGVIDRMLERWYDCLETYHDNNIGYQYREVTVALRGAVVEDEAQAMLDETGLPLYLADNGLVSRITGATILPSFGGGKVEDVHTYHVMPRGLDKGSAVRRYIELKGWDPDECLACGDSPADCRMAREVGTFMLMRNGIDNPKAQAALAGVGSAFVSAAGSTDGFCQALRTLLALR